MVLKKSKIKIPYIRLNFRIVRQSDVRCCERTAVSHRLLLDCGYLCEIVLTIQQICCIFELKKRGQKIINRTFIEVPMFTKKWHELGLTDDDLRNLENVLLKNPKDGDAIQGTGGLRKIRIPMENKGKGKRGGARVIYVDIEIKEIIYFINVYTKNEKDDLSEDEKKAFKAMIKILKEV